MATIREYFDTDARALTLHTEWGFATADESDRFEVTAKIAYDFEANAKYWYLYIPSIPDLSTALGALFVTPELADCRLRPDGDGVSVEIGQGDYSERQSTETLQFTKRVHLYLDFELSTENRRTLVADVL